MRFVAIKDNDQLDVQTLCRVREQLVRARRHETDLEKQQEDATNETHRRAHLRSQEGAIGARHAGTAYRALHDGGGPVYLHFAACWKKTNRNPALELFLDLLRERHPDLPSNEPSK